MSKTKTKRGVDVYLKDNRYNVDYQGIMRPQTLKFRTEAPHSEKLELIFKDGYVGNIKIMINNFIINKGKGDLLLDFFNVLNKEMSILTKIKKNVKLNIEIGQVTNSCSNPAHVSPCFYYPVTIKIDSIGKEYTFNYNILGYDILYKNNILDNCTSVPYQGFYGSYVQYGHQVTMNNNNSIFQTQQPLPHQIRPMPITLKQELINLLKEEITELENDPSYTISRDDVYDIIQWLFNFKDRLMK